MWGENGDTGGNEETSQHEVLKYRENHSRRSFLKRGVVTAGAIGGLSTAGATNGFAQTNERAALQESTEDVLVFLYGYQPNLPFRVLGTLEQINTVRLLTPIRGGPAPEITQPDNYTGYIIGLVGFNVRTPTFLFTEDAQLNINPTPSFSGYQFSPEFTSFSSELSLIQTTISPFNLRQAVGEAKERRQGGTTSNSSQ